MNHLSNSATNMSFSGLAKNNPKKLCFQNIIQTKGTSKNSELKFYESIDDVYERVQGSIKKHI